MQASPAQTKKRLALAILDFLQTSQTDGSVAAEDAEQLEVAANCISDAFKVDLSDSGAVKDALGDQNLLAIYNVYEKLKGKTTATTQGSSSASEARPATPQTSSPEKSKAGPGGVNKNEAERLKGLGNEAMKKKDYASAVKHYSAALEIVPLNPIYLSNRAAAHSGAGNQADAKSDAEMAVAADPSYSKAYSRLGFANFALGDAKGAMEAYKAGMDAEGGGSDVMRRGYETAKKKYEEEGGDVGAVESEASRGAPGAGAGGMPDLASLASMLGGGGGGEGGGMGGLAGLMNNPMIQQAMQSPMVQQMMQDPSTMANLMNNPQMRQMAERFAGGGGAGGGGSGGGMPDLSSMMNDPNIAEM